MANTQNEVVLKIKDSREADFNFIRKVSEAVLNIILKLWAQCGTALLTIILFYWIYGGFIAFLFVFFAFTGLLYHIPDEIIFHPSQPHYSRIYVPSPKLYGLQMFENIFLKTHDGIKINAVFIKHKSQSPDTLLPTIVYLHGNAGNIGHRLPNVKSLCEYVKCNVLLVEYRGYGLSEGYPSEKGMYEDVRAAVEFLLQRSDIDKNKIIIFGRSLGGAVAVDIACDEFFSQYIFCVILENTFTCIPDVAVSISGWKFLSKVPMWCLKNKFNSIAKIKKLSVPVLFLSGLADALIPPYMMLDLYNNCLCSSKQIVKFNAGSHNDTWQCANYYKSIKMFINKVEVEGPAFRQAHTEVIHNDIKSPSAQIHDI
ncbi:Protein ABHD13 [Nymphon striatum]|nr:Protein ABHD13 [Nymphon striatum]